MCLYCVCIVPSIVLHAYSKCLTCYCSFMSVFWCSNYSSKIQVSSINIYQYHGFKCHDGIPFMTALSVHFRVHVLLVMIAPSVHFGVHLVLTMTVLSVHFGNIEE